jgi:predicted SprT family Zn-dependent metalloprotease
MKKQKSRRSVLTPTEQQFNALNGAYTYFNRKLFGNQLPGCILNFSRLKGTHGFMAPERWKRVDEEHFGTHEISLTPTTLYRTPIEIFSTLVHEMCHLWQWEFGSPSRSGYHNKEWAAKMKEVGLIPSDTGKPGGKETGQAMTHYIEEGGSYYKAFEQMPEQFILPFTSFDGEVMKSMLAGTSGSDDDDERKQRLRKLRPPSRNKTKYTCSGCKANIWGKPGLHVICGTCEKDFEAVKNLK